MPRKKRKLILIISIVLIVLIIVGILGYLYLKTDAFKSKETLFAKYLIQNFENIEFLKTEENSEIENILNNNKYISQVEGTIEYTENIGTSDQNQDSEINNVGIKINSKVDKTNNYDYKDISIEKENEKLVGLEYLNQDPIYGIRLNGIQQFVSVENNGENKILDEYETYNIEGLTSKIDIGSILNFTEEEKQTLLDTYIGIIQSNISADKYYKQSNALITVNNKDIQTNAYYIKLTVEEFNNLYIKILEQIAQDEIILSRIDLIENEIKEKYSDYEQDESLRENFISSINDEIEEIKNNNIGNEEVKITVYENNMKTVRTSIEKTTEKLTIDMYNDSAIKIDSLKLGDNTNEQIIKIEKTENETQLNVLIEYEQLQDNEIINNVELNYQQTFENNKLNKKIQLGISNEKYEGILNIIDNTEVVQEFEDQVTLDTDNVRLDELQPEQKDIIDQILIENIQEQLSNLFSVVSLEDYTTMLQNLNILAKNSSIELSTDGQVTDIERNRFNSQFEFFVSENLTSDNIKELLETTENNSEDIKILTKNGEIEDLDTEKLASSEDASEYKENISEILIYIKQNSNNEEKQEETLNFIEDNTNNKYTVSIEYDDDGLASIIRVKIQEDE